MPFHQRINIDDKTEILTWHIQETLEALQKDLTLAKRDQVRFLKRKSLSHQKGFLASRKLLLMAGVAPQTLWHSTDGIPKLESGQQISISHSKTVAGIALGENNLGIDIETFRSKIHKIAPRFLHTAETFALEGGQSTEKLTLIWTAKEALFKVLKQKGIIFSKQICVAPFKWGDKQGTAKVYISDKTLNFSLNFIIEKSYCGTLATTKN